MDSSKAERVSEAPQREMFIQASWAVPEEFICSIYVLVKLRIKRWMYQMI
jgi:hypothetical protein